MLVAEGKGKNDLVEKKRGKEFRNLDTWVLPVNIESKVGVVGGRVDGCKHGRDGIVEDGDGGDGNGDDEDIMN